MAFEVIKGEGVPATALPFSPAIKAGPFVFVSGQASVDETGQIVPDTFENEVRRSFENVRKVLKAAGLDLKDVVQVRSYVARQEDLQAYNQLYRDYFKEPFPARTTIMGCLGNVIKFEVDVVAYKG